MDVIFYKHSTDKRRESEERKKEQKTYSDGGRQQPASMGLSLADLYCLRLCKVGQIYEI